jgi:carotenoid cleavage dioxygenase-like enzyme
VRTFTAPPFAYVHIGNAFESDDGSMLHVDLGVFKDAQILNDLKLQVKWGQHIASHDRHV